MTITALLSGLPSRTMDQATFDAAMGNLMTNLPLFGQQANDIAANLNAIAAGGAYAIPYAFDSGTTYANPGSGRLRFDTALAASGIVVGATGIIRASTVNASNADVTATIATFDDSTSAVMGSIRVVKATDPSKWALFSITALTSDTGWRNISVTVVAASGATPFANNDAVLLFFQRTGDKGDIGPVAALPTLHVRDEKASGTAGGAATAGIATRTLNTVKKNTISGASLSGNQMTLTVAGTYRFRASAPARAVNGHQALIYNVTGAAYVAIGTSEMSEFSGTGTQTRSFANREDVVIAGTTVFELRHAIGSTQSNTTALGNPGSSGQVEVYSEVIVEKVA